jgi:predicted DNA-binding transcriptional regulator AlpA
MSLPETGYVRLPQIIGQKEVTSEQAASNKANKKGPKTPRPAIPAVIPVSRSKWLDGVRVGLYPKPVKCLGQRISAWRVEDIRSLIEQPVK